MRRFSDFHCGDVNVLGSQATGTFPHHKRGVCHSGLTAGAQRPSALANRTGLPACSTLGPNSQEGLIRQHSSTWGTPGPVCPDALASPGVGHSLPCLLAQLGAHFSQCSFQTRASFELHRANPAQRDVQCERPAGTLQPQQRLRSAP